jgi:type VI secretion system protein ImpJ
MQQQALTQEKKTAFYLHAQNPFFHGFLRHQIDPGALAGGIFRLSDCEAILPDGTVVMAENAVSGGLERELEPLRETARAAKPITLYLGVPTVRPDKPAVGDPGEEIVPPPRFIREQRTVHDMARPDQATETAIDHLLLNARILVTDVERQGYETISCGRVIYERDAFVPDPRWLPPLARVVRGSQLWRLADGLVSELRQAIRNLTLAGLGEMGRGGAPLEMRTVAAILGTNVTGLEALLNGEAGSYAFYHELCRLLGGMCGMPHQRELEPAAPPPYTHEDPSGVFLPLMEQIRGLLPVPSAVRRYEFSLREDRYELAFDPAWEAQDLYLSARGDDVTQVLEWIQNAIVCSPESLDAHYKARSRGIPRRHIETPSADIEVKAQGGVVFSLGIGEGRKDLVRKIISERTLVVGEGRAPAGTGTTERPEELALLIPESVHDGSE